MRRRRSVLVVEDYGWLRRSIATYLQRCGLRVSEAGSLREAQSQLDAAHFDAVVIDVDLPDGSGLVLLSRIDARRSVVVTADPDPMRLAGCGGIRHLAKPLDLRELRSAVEAACLR